MTSNLTRQGKEGNAPTADPHVAKPPFVVGLGGGLKAGSATEQALEVALGGAQKMGARVELFGADDIMRLPLYLAEGWQKSPAAIRLIDLIRSADGLVIASPGYHGSISGAVKNAVDYIEETARDERPYLSNIPVGLIGVAAGYQAAMGTLMTLRQIVHALRGWPTPLGVAINTRVTPLIDGSCDDSLIQQQLFTVGTQVAFLFRATDNSTFRAEAQGT